MQHACKRETCRLLDYINGDKSIDKAPHERTDRHDRLADIILGRDHGGRDTVARSCTCLSCAHAKIRRRPTHGIARKPDSEHGSEAGDPPPS